MIDMKIWLKHHLACEDGYKWASHQCKTMQDVWDNTKPEWLIWVATRKGAMSEKDHHLFGLWSAKQVEHLMTDPRSIAALRAKELWIDGHITDEELAAASAAARDAAWDAASAAARDAASAAASAAAWAAARDAQTKWIRKNCNPTFDELK